MAKTYTLTECVAMLNVDYKTFQRWLDKAGIDTSQQISRFDNRIRFLYEEQLEKLAEDHGRTLKPTTEQPTEVIPPSAYKQLLQQVDDIERQSERTLSYLEDYEQRANKALDEHSTGIEQQGARLKEYKQVLSELVEHFTPDTDARLIALEQRFEQATNNLDQARKDITDLQQRNTDLEQKLTNAQARIRELELAKTKRSSTSKSQEPAKIISVTARSFAELHQIDRFHMAKWADEGQFETTLTKRGDRNQHNLTSQQQAAVIVWWNEHNIAYTPCEQCPHEPITQ